MRRLPVRAVIFGIDLYRHTVSPLRLPSCRFTPTCSQYAVDAFTEYGAWVFNTLAWEIARYTTFRIELQGHTESNSQTNREAHGKWELSTERANAARRKLVQNGVGADQVCKVSGYADIAPMPDYAPGDEINRRVTVLLKLKESIDSMSDSPDSTSPTPTINDSAPN